MSNKTILIISEEDDIHSLAVKKSIEINSTDKCYIWNSENLNSKITYAYNSYTLHLSNNKDLKIDDIGSIWWRRPKRVKITANVIDPFAKRLISDGYFSLLNSFVSEKGSAVINNPQASIEASRKTYQLQIARKCGLDVPETIITSSFEEVLDFKTKYNTMVVKPLTPPFSFFGEAKEIVNPNIELYKNEIELCPSIYQQPIKPADDLRITIVKDSIFVAKIKKNNPKTKQLIDWRLDLSSECIPDMIPTNIQETLFKFMDRLGLIYGAIDIRRTPKGEYFFLEINPAGQYLWIEIDTKMKISDKIANELINLA